MRSPVLKISSKNKTSSSQRNVCLDYSQLPDMPEENVQEKVWGLSQV